MTNEQRGDASSSKVPNPCTPTANLTYTPPHPSWFVAGFVVGIGVGIAIGASLLDRRLK